MPKLVLPITVLPGPLMAATTGPPSPGGPGLGLGLEARAIISAYIHKLHWRGQNIYGSRPLMVWQHALRALIVVLMILIRLCFPSYSLFDPSAKGENLRKKRFHDKIRRLQGTNYIGIIDEERGIFSVLCSQTQCHFEFTIFEYKGETERQDNLPPGVQRLIPPGGKSQAGNIALIIPSQMLTPLDHDNIQKFMDGNMAIQLQTRTPQNPIQFIC